MPLVYLAFLRIAIYDFKHLDKIKIKCYNLFEKEGFLCRLSKLRDCHTTILRTNLGQLVEDKINIKAEVRDSVLYIDVPGSMPREAIADFTISAPELRKITVYGASKIETIDEQILQQPNLTLDLNGAAEAELNLAVKTLAIEAKGASKLDLEGQVDAARISLAGAGKVDAEDLIAQTMHINCAGASHAEIHVVRELWAQAAGASRINYSGNPTIKQKIAVGGSFVVRD